MALSIRITTDADIDDCLAIYAPIVRDTAISFELSPPSRDEFAHRLLDERYSKLSIVCVEGDRVVGYAYATGFRNRAAYDWTVESSVYIHPDHHRRGIGRRLYAVLLPGLRLMGYRIVIAGATLPNPGSVGLHEAVGFTLAGVTKNVGYKFGEWHDVGFWEYDLGEIDHPGRRLSVAELTETSEWRRLINCG